MKKFRIEYAKYKTKWKPHYSEVFEADSLGVAVLAAETFAAAQGWTVESVEELTPQGETIR